MKEDQKERLGTYACDQMIKWYGIWLKQASQDEIDLSAPAFDIVAGIVSFFVNNFTNDLTDDLYEYFSLKTTKIRGVIEKYPLRKDWE